MPRVAGHRTLELLLFDKRISHDSRLMKVRQDSNQNKKVAKVRIWAERDFQKIGETFTNKALAAFAGGCLSGASFRRRCKWQTSLILSR